MHYRLTGGKEWLVVSDGRTGAIKFKTEWPTQAYAARIQQLQTGDCQA